MASGDVGGSMYGTPWPHRPGNTLRRSHPRQSRGPANPVNKVSACMLASLPSQHLESHHTAKGNPLNRIKLSGVCSSPDSGRFSDLGDRGLRGYTEKKWFPYTCYGGANVSAGTWLNSTQATDLVLKGQQVGRCNASLLFEGRYSDAAAFGRRYNSSVQRSDLGKVGSMSWRGQAASCKRRRDRV